MGQTTDQIERQLDRKREDLRSNIEELETKIRSVTDWRTRVRKNPAAMLAVAFGGGLLASRMLGRRRSYRTEPAMASPTPPRAEPSPRRREALRHLGDIQAALIGTAATKLQETLADVVPGFATQLTKRRRAARDHGSADPADGDGIQGEGNYEAARDYRHGVERFLRGADVERAARAAAPRDEREAAALAQAEAEGRRHARGSDNGPTPRRPSSG